MRLALAIVSVIFICLVCCSSGTDVTGVWETEAEISWPEFYNDFSGRIEMGVAQYGYEVAGILRFYKGHVEYSPCPCVYVEEGKVNGDLFTFKIVTCDGSRTFVAELQYSEHDDKEWLEGTITKLDSAKALSITFRKTGDSDTLREKKFDEGCPK